MKRTLIALVALLGLLATSGIAYAASEEEPEDTTFNFGYDEQYRILVWGTSASDGLYECAVEGPTDVTYGAEQDGIIEIPLLEQDGAVLSFPARMAGDLAEGLTEAEGPVDYSGSDGACGVVGTSVEGPNGQVNHGMFMKSFNAVYDGPGRGCIVRFLARSGLGKGDQQINVPDVDPDAPQVTEGDVGSVDFESVLADCERGNQGNGNEGNGNGNSDELSTQENRPDDPGAHGRARGQQKKSENADNAPGKSGQAPGRNK